MQGLDGQIFVDETEDVLCLWRASFQEELLTYGMDLFERDGKVWRREQEEHRERAWPPAALEAMLREAGFSQVQVFGGMEERPPEVSDGRLFFVCTNGPGGQTTTSIS